MGGGLLQLVAYGAQDAYITGNPHITFWKVLYKRHTNFAMEAMRVNFTGSPAYGQRSVVVVNRNADLMFRTYLEVTLPDTRAAANGSASAGVNGGAGYNVLWTRGGRRRLGYLLIQQVEIEIGGQVMDRHYGEWMYLWESLTSNFDQAVRLDQMIGSAAQLAVTTPASCQGRPTVMYIPLSFWFCRNPGLALPLIALQYHEVRLNFIFRQATDLVSSQYDASNTSLVWPGGIPQAAQFLPKLKDAAVYIDYIYLDTDERRRFAQQSHEYLIDQLQFGLQQSVTSQTVRLDLTLNHPIKELVWVFQDARKLDCSLPAGRPSAPDTTVATYTQPFSYDDIANRCRIQLNGQDRFDERYGDYFWKVQPYQHHSGGGFESGRTVITLAGSSSGALSTAAPTGTSPGSFYLIFRCTAGNTSTALTSGTVVGTGLNGQGATYAQWVTAGSPDLTILSAVTDTGATMGIVAGNLLKTITVAAEGSRGATLQTGATANATGTIVAFWDGALTTTDPLTITGGNVTSTGSVTGDLGVQVINPINVYSFSLAPEEHQPSGSCNFSRIDTATLVFDSITTGANGQPLANGQFPSKNFPYLFRMYAVNYNIFRVMSGMGGLAYSN
jgi:hypothetical protein